LDVENVDDGKMDEFEFICIGEEEFVEFVDGG